MAAAEFEPVRVSIGGAGKHRTVRNVSDAMSCLRSKKWPARDGPLTRIAARMMKVASSGEITPAEAREAFIDAALEARVLDIGTTH
jgi:hypothetical protein